MLLVCRPFFLTFGLSFTDFFSISKLLDKFLATLPGNFPACLITINSVSTGVHVVGLDINKEALNELQATLSPGKCDTLACDLLNITDIRDTVTGYMDQHGPIDLLVNCAGVAKFEPFFDTTPKAFDLQMGINVKALFYLTQLVTQRYGLDP